MNATTYLQKQLANLNSVFHSIAGDLTDAEWIARPAPGQNLIGFTIWHMPRTQDMMIQTWIRGIPEVAHGERWSQWRQFKPLGVGVGISLADADEIAQSVHRGEVMDYADAVHQEFSAWLKQLDDSDLDRLPNPHQHLYGFSEYQTPGFIEEVKNLYDQPIWGLLMRPCIGHIHRHLGELEVAKSILRARETVKLG